MTYDACRQPHLPPPLDPALDGMLRAIRRLNEAIEGTWWRQFSAREQCPADHWLPSALDQSVRSAAIKMRRLAIMLLNCGPVAPLQPPVFHRLGTGDPSQQSWIDLARALNILQQAFRQLVSATALDLEGTPYANGMLARELQQTTVVVDGLCALIELSSAIMDGRSNAKRLRLDSRSEGDRHQGPT